MQFFSQSLIELQKLHSSITKVYQNYTSPPKELDEVEEWKYSLERENLDWALGLIHELLRDCDLDGNDFDATAVKRLNEGNSSLLGRLFFYTILKAHRRFSAALHTEQISENGVVAKELDRSRKQLERLVAMRVRLTEKCLDVTQSRALFVGKYSVACSIDPGWLRSKTGTCPIELRDIQSMSEECAYDVIVTDPPYGFNTHDDVEKLISVYQRGLENIIRALTPNGQLVLALPDWSHTGRRIPAFAFKEFVIYNVLQIARKQEREAYQASSHFPRLSVNTLPPYYWESERALRRAILHFRFRPHEGL